MDLLDLVCDGSKITPAHVYVCVRTERGIGIRFSTPVPLAQVLRWKRGTRGIPLVSNFRLNSS